MDDPVGSGQSRTTHHHQLESSVQSPVDSVLQAASETFGLRFLLLQRLLHPLSALQSNISHLLPFNMFGMFGGKKFSPAKDIPDLAGKVIIVTGGGWSRLDL